MYVADLTISGPGLYATVLLTPYASCARDALGSSILRRRMAWPFPVAPAGDRQQRAGSGDAAVYLAPGGFGSFVT